MWAIQLAIVLLTLGFFGLRATKMKTKTVKYGGEEREVRERVLNLPMIIAGVATFLVLIIIVLPSFGTIGAGERGVVLRFGANTGKVLEPGPYFVLPFINHVETMDVQQRAYVVEASAASKDLQVVKTKITINYSAVPDQTGYVYENYRHSFEERKIVPAVQEAVKTATALYIAEELIAQRPLVKQKMEDVLRAALLPTHLLSSLSITDFDFSPDFNKAIERKVTANQEALTEKNNRDKKQFLADQIVITAKADAEAIRIKAQAITQQGGAEYVKLMWIEAWKSGGANVPNVIAGGDTAPMFLMNLSGVGK